MINQNARAEYQNYPLNAQQISNLHEEKAMLDKDIKDNDFEIRVLNNKIAKNDYEHTHLNRLHQRQQILQTKKRQLEQMIATQRYLQQELNNNKANDKKFRSTLANQYKQAMEDKKNRAEQQKRRKVEEEQRVIQYNQAAILNDIDRKRNIMATNKMVAQQELYYKEQIKNKEKQERNRQKQQYTRKAQLMSKIETQKDATYKQYYNHFMQGQDRLQNIYQNKAGQQENEKQVMIEQFLRKQQEEYAQKQIMQQQQRINRNQNQKMMLRDYLQSQIQEKTRMKQQTKASEKLYNEQIAQYQYSQRQYEHQERMKKKDEQKRYDQELSHQLKRKSTGQGTLDTSNQHIHNPITNPINFRIGITNPYVIKQYEQTKERYLGDNNLKLRNLALIGSSSLGKH